MQNEPAGEALEEKRTGPIEQQTTSGAVVGMARAAGINSLGNIASRVLGLVREAVISGAFGASGRTAVFDAVSNVPKMVYELLVGGMLSAALVPVLSEYAVAGREEELHRVFSILLTLAGLVVLLVTIVLEIFAPWIMPLLVSGFDPELLALGTKLVRIIVPAILIYGISGLIQAFHYARQRFVYPSMGAPAHNLGMILAVVLLAGKLDVISLSIGTLAAATAQLLVQLPGLKGVTIRLRFDWRHPVVKRILVLYGPVLLSIIIQNVGIIIDRNLASRTVNEAITWMAKATYLIQLPLGLVSMAISLAVLPTLSQIDARKEVDRFKRTLSMGLRLVLTVIIPATIGLLILGRPIIELIFEHDAFTPFDTRETYAALQIYLIGLPFTAIDLLLVFSFYSQRDTITPVIVGGLGVLVYLLVGPALAFAAGWGFKGLVMANSAQLTAHALMMIWVFRKKFLGLGGYGIMRTVTKALGASVCLAAAGYPAYLLLSRVDLPQGMLGEVFLLGGAGGASVTGYLVGARLLKIEEIAMLIGVVRRKLGRA